MATTTHILAAGGATAAPADATTPCAVTGGLLSQTHSRRLQSPRERHDAARRAARCADDEGFRRGRGARTADEREARRRRPCTFPITADVRVASANKRVLSGDEPSSPRASAPPEPPRRARSF